jgi:alanine racemase
MRPTWAEIRLDRIANNYKTIKQLVGNSTQVMAVIKADGYGHGARAIANYLEQHQPSPDWFGVALAEEGIQLRESGAKSPILCLGGFWQEDQAHDCIKYNLIPTIYRFDMLDSLSKAAKASNCKWKFHLKIDTGMSRLGILASELSDFLKRLKNYPNLILDGVMTHLASADELEKSEFTNQQITTYKDCLSQIRAFSLQPTYQHISNSAGTCSWPQAHGNLVRAGGLLYGFTDTIASSANIKVAPALSLHTKIILLKQVPSDTSLGYCNSFFTKRESLIATLPIGYDDGLRRNYSNIGKVLIRGQIAPIVGRVSMDLTLIDVTDIIGAQLGDEVILIGESENNSISAEKMAAMSSTISYELTCGLSGRVPRIYLTEK